MRQLATAATALAITATLVGSGRESLDSTGQQADRQQTAILPDEWMLAAPSTDVLAAVRRVLRERRLRLAHDDPDDGSIETVPTAYGHEWPSAEALGLTIVHTPKRLGLHVHVSRDLEPARLAVGAVLETDYALVPLLPSKWRGGMTHYGQRALSAYVLGLVAASLSLTPEPLAASAEARAAQAARLLPAGVGGGCGVRIASLVTNDVAPQRAMRAPSRPVKPRYPAPQLDQGVGGAVVVRGEVTEHGTYTNVERVGGVEDSNLRAATTGAAGLWRFRPPLVGGCPARQVVTLEMSYSIGR